MKKYWKIVFVAVAVVAAVTVYKYIGFDNEPFDNLKAGEIECAFIEYGEEGSTEEITDIGALPDILDDIELECRVMNPDEDKAGGRVTLWLHMADGTQTFVAVDNTYVQTEKGIFKGDAEENAEFLSYAFRQVLFDRDMLMQAADNRVDAIVELAIKGNSKEKIREIAKDIMRHEGFAEEKIKTFANMGYSPVDIFILDAEYLGRLFDDMVHSANRAGRMLTYENLAEKVWLDYRNNAVKYNDTYSEIPRDFIFIDMINWGEISFVQNEMGYYYVQIPSADGKYYMTVTVDDTVYQNMDGTITDREPFVKNVDFWLQSDFK